MRRDQPIIILISIPFEPLDQIICEQTMPDIFRFKRNFVNIASGDDQSSFAGNTIKKLTGECRSFLIPWILESSPAGLSAITAVNIEYDLLGLDSLEKPLNLIHRNS